MSLDKLNLHLETLKSIRSKMTDAENRMRMWQPTPHCSNFVRSNYHKAYKDLEKLKKEFRTEADRLSNWMNDNDIDLSDYKKNVVPGFCWVIVSTLLLIRIVFPSFWF